MNEHISTPGADPATHVPDEVDAIVERFGIPIDRSRLARWSGAIVSGTADLDRRVRGHATPVLPADIDTLPTRDSAAGRAFEALGLEALRAGTVAMIVLAGGMATRMGGNVKALTEAVPGYRFLDIHLAEQARWRAEGAEVPLWLMTSDASDAAIRSELGMRLQDGSVDTFLQDISLRLTPEGDLFRGDDGALQLYPTGHGDLPDALARSGLLERFLARGGRWLMVANVDNVGATLDPLVLGSHIAAELPLTLEVVPNDRGDVGGGPVRLDGRVVALETFRLPETLAADQMPFFGTNTFWITAQALRDVDHVWTYARVTKDVDGRPAVQFERLLNELTLALPSRFVLVPRHGAGSRFLPVKSWAELERRRGEITAALDARSASGMERRAAS